MTQSGGQICAIAFVGLSVLASVAGGQDTTLSARSADSVSAHRAERPTQVPKQLGDTVPRSPLILVTSEDVERARFNQLADGVAIGESFLMRSPSSLTPRQNSSGVRVSPIAPQFLFVINSAIPFSQNNGNLWAGRGLSTRSLTGFKLEAPHLRLIVAPELILSANSDWVLRHDFYAPDLPPGRSPYTLPYYVGDFTIDQPMRFGNKGIKRLLAGQSTAMVSGNRFQFGASTENQWWGPGLRNAIVLSNNAPGFPHLFVRTARPLNTRIGGVEVRWLVGGLTESDYFDTVSTNNLRSIAALSVTLQTKWDPNLSIGFARTVYATSTGWGQIPSRWLDVFARTSRTARNTGTARRQDHFYSFFGRWVLPENGLEINAEWARLYFPASLRGLFVEPNNSQGYTVGIQWRGLAWRGGAIRLQGEITQLEQSATFRDQPLGSWYTSTRVIQGYTNRGEMLGASIGPGASSQWLAADYVTKDWRVGAFAGRIRWNEDVHSNFGFPAYAAYCNHDVSIYPGLRGAKLGRFGSVGAELTLQNRLNAFFQNAGGCPYDRKLDIRNNTLSLTFTPRW